MKVAKDGTRRGRPEGSANKMAREAREAARATGDGRLPHEILLSMARGEPVALLMLDENTGQPLRDQHGNLLQKLVIPTLEEMKDAAKAAAPYFAPKISTVEVLAGASEDELDRLIAVFAAQAGLGIAPGSEGEVAEGEGGEGEGDEAPAGSSSPAAREREPDAPTVRRRAVTRT